MTETLATGEHHVSVIERSDEERSTIAARHRFYIECSDCGQLGNMNDADGAALAAQQHLMDMARAGLI